MTPAERSQEVTILVVKSPSCIGYNGTSLYHISNTELFTLDSIVTKVPFCCFSASLVLSSAKHCIYTIQVEGKMPIPK
jgi:hypothetical protein